jgi:hypothetical protein
MKPGAFVMLIAGLLTYLIEKKYSKEDKRFRLGIKPKSISLKGWIYIIIIWSIFFWLMAKKII